MTDSPDLAGRGVTHGAPASAFPFFVGFARSGTTLVRAMFDSHPDLAIPGESHFIVPIARHADRYQLNGTFLHHRFLADVFSHPRFQQWGLPEMFVRSEFEKGERESVAEAIRQLYVAYAAYQGKPRYGDKTPVYLLHVRLLGELFPEARFVHIIRDGRDVALSHMDALARSKKIEQVAINWRRSIQRARRAGCWANGRYRELRYEDLIGDPEGVLQSVCPFLEIPFDSAMLRYFERADEIRMPVHHPEIHANLGRPPTKGLRDWRRQMARDDVAVFEAIAGDTLSELGYERAFPKPPMRVRLEALARQLRFQVGSRVGRRVSLGGKDRTDVRPT
jgi:Sulfotransferase family